MNIPVKVKKLRVNAVVPSYETAGSAGCDLRACLDEDAVIAPGETVMIPTGLSMEIPEGYVGLVFARSGLSTKKGLAPANKVGVIDSDYRGEWMVGLLNHSGETRTVEPGERIAQAVFVPVVTAEFCETETLTDTARGAGGFGSTGR